MLKKFKSRKFVLTLLAVIFGVATSLAELGGTAGVIAGMVVAVIPTIVYVITEGRIDEKAVGMVQQDVKELTDGATKLQNMKGKGKDGI